MADQGQSQSSLRQAVDRILGTQPGGSQPLGWGFGGEGQAPATSDITLASRPISDVGKISNLVAPVDQAALTLLSNPIAAAQTEPQAAVATSAAAVPQQMISRADLYELQKQKQMEQYDASKAAQVANLRAYGMSDKQLGAALQPTNWGNASQPADWGKPGSYSYNYMHSTMVPNPYGGAGTTGGKPMAPPSDMAALADWKKTHAWTQGAGGQIIAK